MDKIQISIGSIVAGNSGQVNDNTREVEFVADELAKLTEYGLGRNGGITDSRGVTETLYKSDDDRLIVHVRDWSNWQGETTILTLHEIEPEALEIGGRFEALGAEAGYGRPLTLEEALGEEK